MFKKKLSENEKRLKEVQERNKRILEHNADVELKKAILLRPDLSKLAIIQRLLMKAQKEKELHFLSGNIEGLDQAIAYEEYYKKCVNYQLNLIKKTNLKKWNALINIITDEKPIITVGDYLKSDKFKENVKKQAEAITAIPENYFGAKAEKQKKYKILIEVDPADNEKIKALKDDGFRRHHRSEYKFIDVYFKYI